MIASVSTAAITPTAIHVPREPPPPSSALLLSLLVCVGLAEDLKIFAGLVLAFRKVFPAAARAVRSPFEKIRPSVVFDEPINGILSAAALAVSNWLSVEMVVTEATSVLEVSATAASLFGELADGDAPFDLGSVIALTGPAITYTCVIENTSARAIS